MACPCCPECVVDGDCTFPCCVYQWQSYSPLDPDTGECTGVCADGYSLIDGCICDPTGLPFISIYFPCDGPVPQEVIDGLADPRGQVGGFGFGVEGTPFCCAGVCQCNPCCPCATANGLTGTVTVTFSNGYGNNCATTPIEAPITSLTNCADGLYAVTVDIDIDFCNPPPTACGSLTLYFRLSAACNCETGEGCTMTLDGYDDSDCAGVVSVEFSQD